MIQRIGEVFTISPSYMLSDKALVLAEISAFDGSSVDTGDGEEMFYAVEFIYAF